MTWIVLAQLFGTSLWFSANSAADDPQRLWGLSTADIGWLTNAEQGGFIAGTLGFALTTVSIFGLIAMRRLLVTPQGR